MEKRLRIYLDTNMIYGYFKSKIEEAVKEEYREPRKMVFIKECSKFVQVFTSFFTLMEVAKNLKEEFKLDSEEVIKLIRQFRKKYPVLIIETTKLTGDCLKWILTGIEFNDSVQLNIAKNENLLFVSDDKYLIKMANKFYRKAISFKRLQKIIENLRLHPSSSSF